MANSFTNLLRTWLAAGMPQLRNYHSLAALCGRDYSEKVMEKGDSVKVPLPVTRTAAAVTPAVTAPTPTDSTPLIATITLDQWYYTDFYLTDMQMTQIEAGEFFIPKSVDGCLIGLMDLVNSNLWTKVHGAGGFFAYVGTAATTPFATTVNVLPDAKKALTDNKAPNQRRIVMLDTAAENNALKLADFNTADKRGDTSVNVDGRLAKAFGFDIYVDQQTATHTSGTCTGLLINNGGGYAAGIKTVTTDTGAGTVLAGDIITFAGVSGTYCVVSSVGGATPTSVTFYPGLAGAVADNAAITLKATHVVNLAMHPEALQLVTRPLMAPVAAMAANFGGGSLIAEAIMTDPVTGISIRASAYRQWKQVAVYFDILWGAEVVRQELGARIAG